MPKPRFLVIEDDLFYQTYIRDLLAETGVEILSAADGEEGLRLAVGEKPDLILSDIEIPKMQGFVLLRALRERPETRDIPVILMSGKVERDLLERASQLKVRSDGYLLKPFSGQDMMERIRHVLGSLEPDGQERDAPEVSREGGSGEDSMTGEDLRPGHGETGSSEEGFKGNRSVFVVDDSPYVLDTTSDFLGEIGLEVRKFTNGEDALKAALATRPDLVLLDVQMPGISGFVVCEMLRKEETTKDIPIILMSAVVDKDTFDRHSRLRYHANAYLTKPFMKSELQDMVLRLLPGGVRKTEPAGMKAGFLVPAEGEFPGDGSRGTGGPGSVDGDESAPDREANRKEIKNLKEAQAGLSARLQEAENQRDRLEEEVFRLRSEGRSREEGLNDKLTLAARKYEQAKGKAEALAGQLRSSEEARAALEAEYRALLEGDSIPEDQAHHLSLENRGLKRDLAAALSAKAEIEEQVDLYFKNRREADKKAVETLTDRLEKAQEELQALQSENEEKIRSWEIEKASLKRELSEAEKRACAEEDERELRIKAQTENLALLEKVEDLGRYRARFDDLREKCLILEGKLEESEAVRRELKRELGEKGSGQESSAGEARRLAERLRELEATFNRTVLEAQDVITTQKGRENELREKLDTIFHSLEEEKRHLREERERWRRKEEEITIAFDDALAENRRIMGEEASRFFPVQIPRQARPLEVVTPSRKLVSAMVWAIVFLLVFFSGYMVLSRFAGRNPRQTLIGQASVRMALLLPPEAAFSPFCTTPAREFPVQRG